MDVTELVTVGVGELVTIDLTVVTPADADPLGLQHDRAVDPARRPRRSGLLAARCEPDGQRQRERKAPRPVPGRPARPAEVVRADPAHPCEPSDRAVPGRHATAPLRALRSRTSASSAVRGSRSVRSQAQSAPSARTRRVTSCWRAQAAAA